MYDPKASKIAKARMLLQIARRRAAEGHASVPRQVGELLVLAARNRVNSHLYYSGGLYRRELDWKTKCTFIGPAVYYRAIDVINPRHLRVITNHKVISRGYLASFGIPTVRFFGLVDERNGSTFDGHPLRTPDDLVALLRRIDTRRVCFKLISGVRGRGFIKAVADPDSDPPQLAIEPDGRRTTVDSLWRDLMQVKGGGGYYCEETIEQHPDAARFYPHSVNTIRSWSWRREDGSWELHGAVMRMGVDGMTVDNLSRGGIGPPIDIETGRMRTAIQHNPERALLDAHPTTGVPVAGAPVPMWDRIAALILRTCEVFPMFDLLAVDVAIGVDGPIVTEIESSPDPHQVGFDKGMGPMIAELVKRRRSRR